MRRSTIVKVVLGGLAALAIVVIAAVSTSEYNKAAVNSAPDSTFFSVREVLHVLSFAEAKLLTFLSSPGLQLIYIVISMLLSLSICLFGIKLYLEMMSLTIGLMIPALITILGIHMGFLPLESSEHAHLYRLAILASSILGGIAIAVTMVRFRKQSVGLLGAIAGVFVALVALEYVHSKFQFASHMSSPVFWSIVTLSALAFGLFGLHDGYTMAISTSAVFGSFFWVRYVYVIALYISTRDVFKARDTGHLNAITFTLVTALLTLAGVCVQIYVLDGTELENESFCGRQRSNDCDDDEDVYYLADDEPEHDQIRYV